MKIENMPINELNPAQYNPRITLKPGMPEYESLKRSLEEFSMVDPPIYNKQTGHLVGGHQRVQVARDMGMTELDVSVVDLPLEKEKALNLALNKISGDWDTDLLANLLDELDSDNISLSGFNQSEVDEIIADTNFNVDAELGIEDDEYDPDEVLNDGVPAVVKNGEVWQLGKHVLMCGSSTDEADIAKLMQNTGADLAVTDPPYNVNYQGKTDEQLNIQNDDMDETGFKQFLLDAFTNMATVMKEGSPIYVFYASKEAISFLSAFKDAGFEYKEQCIWVKNQMVLGRQDYQWQHEPIMYGWKPGDKHYWNADRKQTTIWEFDKPQRNGEHPTMKPIDLIAYPIVNSCKRNAIVLDPFAGSGSTLIACEKTGRINRSMELDPKYCDVIINRWETLTGGKAKKLNY